MMKKKNKRGAINFQTTKNFREEWGNLTIQQNRQFIE